MALKKGANLVGNPFAFPIPISSLYTQRARQIAVYRYHGTWNLNEEDLQPFEGYAVISEVNDTLLIDPNPRTIPPEATQTGFRSRDRTIWDVSQLEELLPSRHIGVPLGEHRWIGQAYPNPFSEHVTIELEPSEDENADAALTVYDVLGRHVVSLNDPEGGSGKRWFIWDGTDASGQRWVPGFTSIGSRSAVRSKSEPSLSGSRYAQGWIYASGKEAAERCQIGEYNAAATFDEGRRHIGPDDVGFQCGILLRQ